MTPSVPTVRLTNGVSMPQLGLGVWQASNEDAEKAVGWALEAGYRLIDTAAMYRNETGVGRAVALSDIAREDIFVTTKLWNSEQGYDKTLRAFEYSLENLGLDYLDLYLIHWPVPALGHYQDTWKAFERLYEEKRIRAIGVSNFQPEHLEKLLSTANVVPAVNQIELHPYLQQHETREFCSKHDIKIESWSPIGGSKSNLLDDSALAKLAEKHGKTPAQIVIRWHVQNELIVIPKSVHQERIQENISVFDFELDDADMKALAALDRNERFGPNPATANFT